MAPRCMHNAALVASFTAVSMRIASSGSTSIACGTRSTPLVPGIRMSHSMSAMRWRRSCCRASSPLLAAYTSYCCCVRNFLRALRMGSSSSTTRIWTGPVTSATAVLLIGAPLTFHEADLHRPREQARPAGAREQLGHRLSADRAVVHGVCVDVHPDEPVDAGWVETARDVAHQRVSQVAAHDVAAKRQRQARLVVPPFAEIDPEVQPTIGIGELTLVNEDSR